MMAKVPPPTRKGSPPPPVATVGNLDKPEPGELSHLNFRVPKAFHREFAIFAAVHDKSQTQVLFEAFELLKQKYPSTQ
jgi:hypothetical protein